MFALLSLLTVALIWGNPLKAIPQSSAQSTAVAQTVQPIVDSQQRVEPPVFHSAIRKLAYLAEFFALGFFVTLQSS